MERGVDLSLSGRTRQYVVAGFVSLWVVALSLAALSILVDERPGVWGLAMGVMLWTTLTVAWVGRAGDPDAGSAWDAIPKWQYEGRFVRGGGITREEQEDALEQPDDRD